MSATRNSTDALLDSFDAGEDMSEYFDFDHPEKRCIILISPTGKSSASMSTFLPGWLRRSIMRLRALVLTDRLLLRCGYLNAWMMSRPSERPCNRLRPSAPRGVCLDRVAGYGVSYRYFLLGDAIA